MFFAFIIKSFLVGCLRKCLGAVLGSSWRQVEAKSKPRWSQVEAKLTQAEAKLRPNWSHVEAKLNQKWMPKSAIMATSESRSVAKNIEKPWYFQRFLMLQRVVLGGVLGDVLGQSWGHLKVKLKPSGGQVEAKFKPSWGQVEAKVNPNWSQVEANFEAKAGAKLRSFWA